MKADTLGYIVCDSYPSRLPMWQGKEGVLWMGDTATVFPSRRDASRAIKDSLAYARSRGLSWGSDYRIMRLVKQAVASGRATNDAGQAAGAPRRRRTSTTQRSRSLR